MKIKNKLWVLGIIAFIIFDLSIIFVHSDIIGPQILKMNSTRRIPNPALSVNLLAGNVSNIDFNVTSTSSTWAAYYGNITGTIVLGNTQNKQVYRWNITNPKGKVFMANDSVDFNNLECWNDSKTDPSNYLTLSKLETNLGLESSDIDGVNETFSKIGMGTHKEFYVGTKYFRANSCPATNLNNASGKKEFGKFEEVLTYEPTKQIVVYTALIQTHTLGFNGKYVDFEIIVGENGHNNNQATNYNVYIELD
jgi:hypothetical protein